MSPLREEVMIWILEERPIKPGSIIENISASEKEVVIKLEVNPITENLFGIVVSP